MGLFYQTRLLLAALGMGGNGTRMKRINADFPTPFSTGFMYQITNSHSLTVTADGMGSTAGAGYASTRGMVSTENTGFAVA